MEEGGESVTCDHFRYHRKLPQWNLNLAFALNLSKRTNHYSGIYFEDQFVKERIKKRCVMYKL